MNDEIKEILDNFKNYEERYKQCNENQFIIFYRDIHLLLDYITNLQQKVEQYENPDDLTLFYMWLDEKAKDKMKELQQENQILKEHLEAYKKDGDETQDRIDKAIIKLEESQKGLEEWHFDGYDPDLLGIINILKGDNND